MTTTRKTLGQSAPAANTDTTLYTVPAANDTVIASLVICETGGAPATVRVTIDPAGGAVTVAGKSVAWALPIASNDTVILQFGGTLAAGTTIVIRSTTATVTFNAFGQENS